MVTFRLYKTIGGVGDTIDYNVSELDSTKGFYITAIANYNESMNDYSLAQLGQLIIGRKNHNTSGASNIYNWVDITEDIYNLNVQTLTIVYFDNYGDFLSQTEFEENVTLGQYTAKSENFTVTIYNGKRLSGIITWLRQWFNTKEEHDEMLLTDSGWKTCTLSSGYAVYASGTTLRVKKVGKMVHATGIFKNNNTLSASSYVQFATLPLGYRPSQEQVKVCQGSDMNRWLLRITADGAMTLSRYGTSSDASASSGRWLPYCITYMVD